MKPLQKQFTLKSVGHAENVPALKQREERDRRIRDLWLACATAEEVVKEVGLQERQVYAAFEETAKLENFPKPQVSTAQFADADFQPPLYNIWNFKSNTNTTTHFGNSMNNLIRPTQ